MSLYNGKAVVWLTKEKEKRRQYWAVGEHKDRTEVRLEISTINFCRLRLPDSIAERAELFRMGAVETKLWSERDYLKPISEDHMNWYTSETKHLGIAETFSAKLGRYIPIPQTPEEEREFLIYKLQLYNNDDFLVQCNQWYRWRWNQYYCDKLGIKLEEIWS